MFKNLFISYGRRESLGFVARLHQKIKLAGYEAWFDKANIPDGEDYAARISYGIEYSHNFVYVMAARALSSPYCLIEIEYARFLGKRVIPINQAVIFQIKDYPLSEADQQVLQQFYSFHGITDPQIQTTQQVLERSLALVGRTDWLDAKENISNQDCEALANWARTYENQWHKHESLEYLQSLELPQFGETIDSLDSVIERLILVLERHQYYVAQQTLLTTQALEWSRNQSLNHYLLVGKERQAAEEWLLVKFQEGEQAPCTPCDLLCDFICESRKNAENRMTDCFICYDYADKATRDVVIKALARHAITTWRHDNDIQRGSKAEQAILSGIAGADNVLYFISPDALVSEACNEELAHAREFNKRIIPLLIKATPNLPAELQQLQYIPFIENPQHGFAELLRVLHIDNHYYEQHKMLLARALEWQAGVAKTSFLLRGYNLENAKTWLRLNKQREQHAPTALHIEFITASEAAKERLGTEVFLSYSRKDGDFARKLNRTLQESGKTVWFDQESISSGANFEIELYKGIQNSDNFLFVISPDSVTSPYCESEVNYAAQQGKRMVSVLCRETEPSTLPEALKFINWIDFAQQDFDKQFPELIQTLELDREHAHQHTVLQQRANEWLDNQESHDFLLNISACEKSEQWLNAATNKQPRVTELQARYIKASRAAIESARCREQRRQRIVLGSVLVGLVIALILAVFSWDKSVEAEKQTEIARKNSAEAEQQRKNADEQREITRQTSQVNKLVHISDRLFRDGDYTRALRVAQEAYDAHETDPKRELLFPSVELALSNAYNKIADGETLFYQHILQHEADVENALYSPDGLSILTASRDGSAQLWDSKGNKYKDSKGTLRHGFWVKNAAFSPDGQYIATVRDYLVRLWDKDGNEIDMQQANPKEDNIISAVAFSPNSQYLVSKESNKIRLWNINGELLKSQKDEGCKIVGQLVGQVVFSPNGQYIATASNNKSEVKIWKSKNLELFDTVKFDTKNEDKCPTDKNLSTHGVTGISFTSDGERLITTTKGHGISIFMLKNKKLQAALHEHQNPVHALAVAPDGKSFASGDSVGEIIVWDMDGKPRKRFQGHHRKVNELSYSADSKTLLSASNDRTAKLWDLEGTLLANYNGHQGKVKHAHISPDGQFVLTASGDNTAKLWPIRSTTSPTVLTHKAGVAAVKFLPNSQQLITAANDSDLSVQRWDRDKKTMLQRYEGYDKDKHGNKRIYSLDISPDGKQFLTTGTDYFIRVHNVEDGKIIHKWDGGHRSNCSVYGRCGASYASYSKDGKYIITGDYVGDIAIWTHTGESVNRFTAHKDAVIQGITVSPDNRYIVTASDDNMVRVWDFLGDLKNPPFLYRTLTQHDDTVWAVEFSADGKYLASASEDRTANIWQLEDDTKKPIRLSEHSEAVLSVHFGPYSKQLITTSKDKTSKVWSLKTGHKGELIRTLEGHSGAVTNAAFAADGSIATTSEDKTVRIWPSTKKIYEWAKNNKDIYQLTDEDRKALGIIEEE